MNSWPKRSISARSNLNELMKLDLKILDARMRDFLPAYATTGSAGARPARVPQRTAHHHTRANLTRADRPHDSLGDPGYAAVILPRSGLRDIARNRARQSGRADRLGLSGPIDDLDMESRRYALSRSTRWNVLAQMVIVPVVQAELNIVDEFA